MAYSDKVLGQHYELLMQATVTLIIIQNFLVIGFCLLTVLECSNVCVTAGQFE